MMKLSKLCIGTFVLGIFANIAHAQDYISYSNTTDQNLIRSKIVLSYWVLERQNCRPGQIPRLANQASTNRSLEPCEPVTRLVPPTTPEYHYVANDEFDHILKFKAYVDRNGVFQVVGVPLSTTDLEISNIVKNGRHEITSALLDVRNQFENQFNGNITAKYPKLVDFSKAGAQPFDCTQGTYNENYDSSLDAIKSQTNAEFRSRITEGTISTLRSYGVSIESFNLGASRNGPSASISGIFTAQQYAEFRMSDGGIVHYSFDQNGQPYLDLSQSYAPPMYQGAAPIQLSELFRRQGGNGRYEYIGQNIVDLDDQCIMEELEDLWSKIGTTVVDNRDFGEGAPGQCMNASSNSNGDITFSYWTQSAVWSDNYMIITARRVSVTLPAVQYRLRCR